MNWCFHWSTLTLEVHRHRQLLRMRTAAATPTRLLPAPQGSTMMPDLRPYTYTHRFTDHGPCSSWQQSAPALHRSCFEGGGETEIQGRWSGARKSPPPRPTHLARPLPNILLRLFSWYGRSLACGRSSTCGRQQMPQSAQGQPIVSDWPLCT